MRSPQVGHHIRSQHVCGRSSDCETALGSELVEKLASWRMHRHEDAALSWKYLDQMSLEKTIEVVTKLAERGTIKQYAITGAVAALNYIQPTLTEDLDILVSTADFGERKGLILLAPIESALATMGSPNEAGWGLGLRVGRSNFCPSPRPWTRKL